jgi:hypothetical protein
MNEAQPQWNDVDAKKDAPQDMPEIHRDVDIGQTEVVPDKHGPSTYEQVIRDRVIKDIRKIDGDFEIENNDPDEPSVQ